MARLSDSAPVISPATTAVPQAGWSTKQEFLCVGGLLLLHLAICLHAASSETVTHDEIWHLPVGMRNLSEGRFDIERVNPPLTRMWAAVPVVVRGIHADPQTSGQDLGRKFVLDHPHDFSNWYFLGRCSNVMWSLATAVLVYLWSRRLFRCPHALFPLIFYVTCPNIAAHASVVTPDTGGMFGFVATLLTVLWWCDQPTWNRAAGLGVMLGIAQGIKFTCLLLFPLVILIPVLQLWGRRKNLPADWKVLSGQIGLALVLSLPVLWGCYGFQKIGLPLKQFTFQSQDLLTVQKLFSFAGWLPIPFPQDYLFGIDEQRAVMAGAHPVYLDGQWTVTGFRSYFVMALLYKLPHLFQLFCLIPLILFIIGRPKPRPWKEVLTLLLPVLLIIKIASGESLQLGLRYILPVLPLLMIFSGYALPAFHSLRPLFQRAGIVFLCLGSLLSLRYAPGHLAYFNELAGGPPGGRYHLLDSNLDWGQDLGHMQNWLKEQGIEQTGLAYFGTVPPQVLGIDYELPPSWEPQPGRYAVSVNFVMGRPHGITQGDGTSRAVDFQEFAYFQFFEPVRNWGGSIDFYDISAADVAAWRQAMEQLGNRE